MGWLKKTFKKINKTFDKFMPESVKKATGTTELINNVANGNIFKDTATQAEMDETNRLLQEQTNITNNYWLRCNHWLFFCGCWNL